MYTKVSASGKEGNAIVQSAKLVEVQGIMGSDVMQEFSHEEVKEEEEGKQPEHQENVQANTCTDVSYGNPYRIFVYLFLRLY